MSNDRGAMTKGKIDDLFIMYIAHPCWYAVKVSFTSSLAFRKLERCYGKDCKISMRGEVDRRWGMGF